MITRRIARQTGLPVREARVAGAQHGYQHIVLTLAGGRRAFAKVAAEPGPGATADGQTAAAFAAEASGLRWLAEADAVPVPEVLAVTGSALVISMIPAGRPTSSAAFRFGAELARLHAAGAGAFGAPWRGFIASLPLDNTPAPDPGTWPQWYASRRLLPYLRMAVDSGALRTADARLVETVTDRIESLAGPAEPPSRIHGDCWAGNVLWSGDRGWLIDPAAHGGHRETDLAMLALFGAPNLDRILAAYQETVPLADGWRARIPLHQLHPLLVHVCLFGAGYRESALASPADPAGPLASQASPANLLARVGIVVPGHASPRLGRERQSDPERRALAGRGPHRGRAAVRADEGPNDRQAEPAAAGGARPGLVRAIEPLEHAMGLFRGHAGPVVGHIQRHGRGRVGRPRVERPRPDRHLDRRTVRRVGERVAHQVADDLPQPRLVADDEERGAGLNRQFDGPVRGEQAGVVHRVGGQREQVYGLPGQRPLLVEPGQQQQVLDEQAHPGRFLLHPVQDPVQVVWRKPAPRGLLRRLGLVPARDQAAALAVVLGEAADRGQWRTQLVAGVGDEAPHPLF